MPNPPDMPRAMCCEIGCWGYEKVRGEDPPKECLRCTHNICTHQHDEPLKDMFMTPTQKWGY
jgi:hypothetical protein